MESDLLKTKNQKSLLLGNEAIIRGALESGVQFVSTYPGTPASEIGNIFYRIAQKQGVYFEFSTNEKVAMEAAAGASFSGLRSLVAMKNFGLNVASDFLYPLLYTGVPKGMVIVVADDPSCWSSAQSEDNSRWHDLKAKIPTLEPSTPQECKDFVKIAFELSEKFKTPVMIRETTRVAHQSAPVILGNIPKKSKKEALFVKNPDMYSTMAPRVFKMKKELLDKIKNIEKIVEKSPLNFVKNQNSKSKKIGAIASGVSYLYLLEALENLNIKIPILKLGFFYPLPEKKIKNFIKNLDQVLIIEELEPFLEKEIERLAKDVNPKLKINGKNLLPEIGELKPEYIILALSKILKVKPDFDYQNHLKKVQEINLPKRNPQLCPGCPYHIVFSTIKKLSSKNTVIGGEIGCYMLATYPPYEIQDYLYCMGSDISIAHGIKKATKNKQKVIAFIGDSSFFHAGIPALVNTVYNNSNPLIIILNNSTTAMTGHQPYPGDVGINIENVVRACGVKNVKTLDQTNIKEFEDTVKDFLEKDEVSVIIATKPCIFVNKK
ncbi:MAG: thiamine pyrophosphate-dependent enzyme [Candidatus Pacebacteria bacterium]|nr:thiamine pyrophosphate-dependent enzyme [Candidatus Paceibacterota bacterium]